MICLTPCLPTLTLLTILLTVLTAPATATVCYAEKLRLANATTSADGFGASVALTASNLFVGASGSLLVGGAVFAYRLDPTTSSRPSPSLLAKFAPADGTIDDGFGAALAVSGATLVVGAPGLDAAYVLSFNASTGAFAQVSKLTSTAAGLGSALGTAVAIYGNLVVVGAPGTLLTKGTVVVYQLAANRLSASQVLSFNGDSGSIGDGFGGALALFGSVLLVGASSDSSKAIGAGAVYIYNVSASAASYLSKAYSPAAVAGGAFGSAVAMASNAAVVGAKAESNTADVAASGMAYAYSLSGGSLALLAKLSAGSSGASSDSFGAAVATDGLRAIVGAPDHAQSGHTDSGAAYVFNTTNNSSAVAGFYALAANDSGSEIDFGQSVAVLDNIVAVGASSQGLLGTTQAGVVYLYVDCGSDALTSSTATTTTTTTTTTSTVTASTTTTLAAASGTAATMTTTTTTTTTTTATTATTTTTTTATTTTTTTAATVTTTAGSTVTTTTTTTASVTTTTTTTTTTATGTTTTSTTTITTLLSATGTGSTAATTTTTTAAPASTVAGGTTTAKSTTSTATTTTKSATSTTRTSTTTTASTPHTTTTTTTITVNPPMASRSSSFSVAAAAGIAAGVAVLFLLLCLLLACYRRRQRRVKYQGKDSSRSSTGSGLPLTAVPEYVDASTAATADIVFYKAMTSTLVPPRPIFVDSSGYAEARSMTLPPPPPPKPRPTYEDAATAAAAVETAYTPLPATLKVLPKPIFISEDGYVEPRPVDGGYTEVVDAGSDKAPPSPLLPTVAEETMRTASPDDVGRASAITTPPPQSPSEHQYETPLTPPIPREYDFIGFPSLSGSVAMDGALTGKGGRMSTFHSYQFAAQSSSVGEGTITQSVFSGDSAGYVEPNRRSTVVVPFLRSGQSSVASKPSASSATSKNSSLAPPLPAPRPGRPRATSNGTTTTTLTPTTPTTPSTPDSSNSRSNLIVGYVSPRPAPAKPHLYDQPVPVPPRSAAPTYAVLE